MKKIIIFLLIVFTATNMYAICDLIPNFWLSSVTGVVAMMLAGCFNE